MVTVSEAIKGFSIRAFMRPVFVILLSLVGSSKGQEDISGLTSLTYLEGAARVRKPGSEGWLKNEESAVVSAGDSVRSLADSRAEIKLADNYIIRIGPLTIIGIDDAEEVTLQSGDIWTVIEPIEQPGSMKIKSPITIAEIGEAVARFSVGEDGSTEIKVYDGQIDLRILPARTEPESESSDSISNEATDTTDAVIGEEEILLGANHKIIVTSGGEIVYHSAFGSDDLDEDTDWVRWNKERDQNEQDSNY